MRVSAPTKAATREKILNAALRLFAEKGFDLTTTRDIAEAVPIATGTLFNYFPTKEAIVAGLANEAAEASTVATAARENTQTLEEALLALITGELRRLKPLRKYLPALLETTLSPLAMTTEQEPASFRVRHMEAVITVASKHGRDPLSPVALQLYWTLYTGILVFWSKDKSPKQEDALALIDDSLNMYVSWLRESVRTDANGRNR